MDSSFSRSAAILVAGRAVGFICRFTMAVVLARELAAVEFGLYKQAFLLQSTFGNGQEPGSVVSVAD